MKNFKTHIIIYFLILIFIPGQGFSVNSGNTDGTASRDFILNVGDDAGDVALNFGSTLGKYFQWSVLQDKFELNDDLFLLGNLEQGGNTLSLDSDNAAGGANISIVANQGSDNNGEIRYNATSNVWELSNDGEAFFALEPTNATDDIFSAYDAAGGTAIGNTATDIPFDTEIREDSDYTHANDSAEITINTTGQYLADYQCTMDATGTARYIVNHWIETDTGGGFSELAGTRTGSYHRTTGFAVDNGNIKQYIAFTTGDKIKTVAQASAAGVITTVANGCRLTIQRLDNADGLIGPQGPQGIQGLAGTDGVSGGGWGDDGVTTTTALDVQIDGGVNIDGELGSPCGFSAVFWSERGTITNNEGWAHGNGQSPWGSPMGCAGTVTRLAAVCTGSSGTSLGAEIRVNDSSTACNVNVSTTLGQATTATCNETFGANDVVGVYSQTEVGAWSECVGTFWVRYD